MSRISIIFVCFLAFAYAVSAQQPGVPEISINGVKLADRESGKAFLTTYLPTTDEQGRSAYYFYNDLGNQVWKVTAASFDDPFMIVEMEVYTVGTSYTKAHNYLQKTGYFVSESKIHVGKKETVTSALLGEGLASDMRTGPKDIVKKKGEPTKRLTENGRDVFVYEIPGAEFTNEKGEKVKYDYTGRYEFKDKRLKRFVFSIKAKG